jgi:hypothetical protein
MPARLAILLCLLLSCGAAAAQTPAKPKFPSKMGIFAMTSEGPVELKVSGEPNNVAGALKLESFYSADSFDKIPKAAWVRSFYVSAMNWIAWRLYLVVGRDALVDSLNHYQMLSSSVISRGVIAFEVTSADLQDLAWVRQSIMKLAPAGVPEDQIEAYIVLELKSTSGLNNRNYPIKIAVPPRQ